MPRIFAKYDPNFPGDTKYHGSYSLNLITKQWEFKGYKCVHCDQIFKQNPTTGKHQNNCKGISRKKPKDEEDMPTLLDKRGKEWKPLETNQVLSRTKPNYRDINK
jgi:uncharacterized C2H2 Zn-finger protein